MAELSPTYAAFLNAIAGRTSSGGDPFAGLSSDEVVNLGNAIAFGVRPMAREEQFIQKTGIGFNELLNLQQNYDFASRVYLQNPSPQTGQIIATALSRMVPVWKKLIALPESERPAIAGLDIPAFEGALKTLGPRFGVTVPLEPSRVATSTGEVITPEENTRRLNELKAAYPGLSEQDLAQAVASGTLSAPTAGTQASAQVSAATAPPQPTKQFYRIGGDIFEAGTGRHIGPTEWNRDWTGRAQEVSAPAEAAPAPQVQAQVVTPEAREAQGAGPEAQLQGVFKEMFDALQTQLDELQRRGQVINPNVEITPEKAAEFMRQSEAEINPFYSDQLKVAREGFLRSLGFSREQVLQNELALEKQYGRQLRATAESAAERGFALSGIRRQEEQELSEETQRQLEAGRRQLAFSAGTAGREFATRFGAGALGAIPTLGETPRILAGAEGFQRTGRELPFYELSPETYQNLVGSEEFERRGAVQRRASELEEAFRREQQLAQQRQLYL